jgi:hypothetical protein
MVVASKTLFMRSRSSLPMNAPVAAALKALLKLGSTTSLL